MRFDTEEHKKLCIQMIQAGTYPGQMLELVLQFKQAVISAVIGVEVEEEAKKDVPNA